MVASPIALGTMSDVAVSTYPNEYGVKNIVQ